MPKTVFVPFYWRSLRKYGIPTLLPRNSPDSNSAQAANVLEILPLTYMLHLQCHCYLTHLANITIFLFLTSLERESSVMPYIKMLIKWSKFIKQEWKEFHDVCMHLSKKGNETHDSSCWSILRDAHEDFRGSYDIVPYQTG